MSETRIAEIDTMITVLKADLASVRGTETEVYTRIVGYYRSVKNWNAGKREEYGQRKVFNAEKAVADAVGEPKAAGGAGNEVPGMGGAVKLNPKGYVLFTRDLCPNCPPVKEYVNELGIDGVHVDVDTEEGLSAARHYGVMASPTVIFFDGEKKELFRAHNLSDLKKRMEIGIGA
jgi:hypothetical protein